jgi:thiol:disulfide interchange protein
MRQCNEPFVRVERHTLIKVRKILILLALLLAAMPVLHAQSAAKAQHLTVELVSRDSALVPGHNVLGLDFNLEPGWHVYWSNAGDSGEPPDVKWTLPAGVYAGAILFPSPKRLPLGPLMDFGYEDAVLFPVPVRVANDAPRGPARISAAVRWLVCREVCIPGKATLDLALPIANAAQPNAALAPLFQATVGAMPVPLPADADANVTADKANFYLTVTTGRRESSAEFFPRDQNQISNAAPQTLTPQPDGVRIAIKKDENLASNPATLKGVIELSGNRNYLLIAPVTVGMAGSPAQGAATGGELLRILCLAFFGGIILNLMPCVFPVLFIKGLGLLQAHGAHRARARKQGLVYALGILVSFWAIVAVLLALRAGGGLFGWGFQFQSPTFVAIITLLLFFFALSLAGMFEFGLSATSVGGGLAQKQGYSGSFWTGVLATVVATPCTAPFMGAAIGFALAQTAVVTFVIFTAIALGLAAPYVLLTIFPAWTRILPKPGAWMELLKQVASVPIFATVIWLVWLYVKLTGVDLLPWLLAGLLLAAAAGFTLHRWMRSRVGDFAAGVLVLLAIAAPIYGQHLARVTKDPWQPWTAQAVTDAQAAGHPVFVDFTAAWCLSCQFNERTVLNSQEVRDTMASGHMVQLRADWTHYDPAITSSLAQLGRSGVPTYVVYAGKAGAPPDVLPEALTQSIVLDAIHKASNP